MALHEGLGGCSLLKKRKRDNEQQVMMKAGSDQGPAFFCSFLTEMIDVQSKLGLKTGR